MNDPYVQIAEAIIEKLTLVLKEMSLERARSVPGLELDAFGHVVAVPGRATTLEGLVRAYQELLGPAGISFARSAAHPIVVAHPEIMLPPSLK